MGLNETQKKERSEYLDRNLEITECSQRKPYAFISYASDNWEAVFKTAVVPMQRQYGLRVYADKAFDKVNDKWIVPMLRNVRGANVIVAFVSQSYIESYACFLELLTAVNNRKQIVFVSLEDQLRLGDTTDLPVIERGAKNEIINQGANIATNTNNTSNDIMRAMKSAYTSLSTLLEQDALSKYDISDAFINFFRDASINRKTINDLGAVCRTIKSVSRNVFDKALTTEPAQKPASKPVPVETAEPIRQTEPAPAQTIEPAPVKQAEPAPAQASDLESVRQPDTASVQPVEMDSKADFSFSDSGPKTKRSLNVKLMGAIACAIVVVLVGLFVILGGAKNVTDMTYTTPGGVAGTYTGEWKKDQPEGQGTMTGSDGTVYTGEWKDGVLNGKGTATYANGDVYEGEWKDSLPNGQGTTTYANGNVYEGEWKDGLPNGQGTYTHANGAVYEGEHKDGLRDGQGTYTDADGNVWTSEWKDDKLNGQGIATYARGSTYEGEWKDDKRDGQGTYTGADGNVWTGEWKDNKLNGQGSVKYADGGTYEGGFADNVFSGQGSRTWDDGTKYTGEYKDGKFNGKGIITYKGGSTYEGEFIDGEKNGEGVYTKADGTVVNEKWDRGTKIS